MEDRGVVQGGQVGARGQARVRLDDAQDRGALPHVLRGTGHPSAAAARHRDTRLW